MQFELAWYTKQTILIPCHREPMDCTRRNPLQRGMIVQVVDDIHHQLSYLSILTDACPALDGLEDLEQILIQEL